MKRNLKCKKNIFQPGSVYCRKDCSIEGGKALIPGQECNNKIILIKGGIASICFYREITGYRKRSSIIFEMVFIKRFKTWIVSLLYLGNTDRFNVDKDSKFYWN